MADVHTSHLCVQIIHSHFGALTAAVASVLLTRGRLSFIQLVRFSSLKPWIVRAAILVLVQHNILWHAQTEDEGEVVEVNIEECLMRLRFGKLVWLTDQIFGKAAAEIVQLILDHGKLRPPDILSTLLVGDQKSAAVYQQALHKLVAGSYLKPSTVLSHISTREKRIKYEVEERSRISGIPTAKQLREAKELVGIRLKREDEAAEKISMKRKAQDQPDHRPSKRKPQEYEQVDEHLHFRLNYEKYQVHIRNALIVKAVKERFNDCAARVMEALLKVTEANQKRLADIRTEPVSIANIVMQLSNEDDLVSGLVLPTNARKPSVTTCVKDYLGLLSSADNPSPAGKATGFTSFLNSRVQVEFEVICRRLRQHALEAITFEKHGTAGVRIMRLLLEMGKMDEKQISKIVMMAPKDVRPLLMALSTDSLISMQEVPKSADRNPTRTFYLWYVDLRKACSIMLANMYKTLHNIEVRRQSEREVPEIRAVLEKRERIDVSQDETLLSRLERDLLRSWEEKQEKLTVLEMRVDESIFILRDLADSPDVLSTPSAIYQVPAGDVLIHAGDLTSWGYPRQVGDAVNWLASLDHPMKIIIAGNHDLCLDSNIDASSIESLRTFRAFMKSENLYYLENEMIKVNSPAGKTWHVYGSPSSPRYAEGAFQYTTAAEADGIYQRIPENTEILITHTPPNGILDRTKRGKQAGCERLAERLKNLKSCRLHVFGHIHEGAGAMILPDGRVAVNAALALGRPIIVDLKDVPF
ncbi:hypothetical protein APHAL10511_001327 [Amanita phalloides]|nr:hypothetical protein APHAL10511_001327 [Amanita phalloides]